MTTPITITGLFFWHIVFAITIGGGIFWYRSVIHHYRQYPQEQEKNIRIGAGFLAFLVVIYVGGILLKIGNDTVVEIPYRGACPTCEPTAEAVAGTITVTPSPTSKPNGFAISAIQWKDDIVIVTTTILFNDTLLMPDKFFCQGGDGGVVAATVDFSSPIHVPPAVQTTITCPLSLLRAPYFLIYDDTPQVYRVPLQ